MDPRRLADASPESGSSRLSSAQMGFAAERDSVHVTQAYPAVGAAPDDEADDDLRTASTDTWVTWLFGAGASLWPFIRTEITVCLGATVTAMVAAILSAPSVCPPDRCRILHESVSHWLFYAAAAALVSIPGRTFDRLFFAAVAAAGQLVTFSILLPIFFYVSAFEGAISRLWWLSIVWSMSDSFLTLRNSDALIFDDLMRSLLVFQLLSIGRQLALRIAMRTVLIGSFETRIQDSLFQNLVLLTLGQRHVWDKEGSGRMVPTAREVAIRELSRIHRLDDFRRKLDFVSKVRFRLFAKRGDLVALTKKDTGTCDPSQTIMRFLSTLIKS